MADIFRGPLWVNRRTPVPDVVANQQHNLLTATLAVIVALPFQTAEALPCIPIKAAAIPAAVSMGMPKTLYDDASSPVGKQAFDYAARRVTNVHETSRGSLLPLLDVSFPFSGHSRSAPQAVAQVFSQSLGTPKTLYTDASAPVGYQSFDPAPRPTYRYPEASQSSSLSLLSSLPAPFLGRALDRIYPYPAIPQSWSFGAPKTLYTDSTSPFVGWTVSAPPRKFQVTDTSSGTSSELLLVTTPFFGITPTPTPPRFNIGPAHSAGTPKPLYSDAVSPFTGITNPAPAPIVRIADASKGTPLTLLAAPPPPAPSPPSRPKPSLVKIDEPPTTRDISWESLVVSAWGAEFRAPDHGIYEFSNGRKWDSTDKGKTGLYGVDVTEPLEAESNYPDMDNSLQTSSTDDILFTENPDEN